MNKKRIIFFAVTAILLGMAALCYLRIVYHDKHIEKQSQELSELVALTEQYTDEQAVRTDNSDGVMNKYNRLYQKNPDMIGWLSIKNTSVNYPVMFTPTKPNYYLRRNYDRKSSYLGLPYIQENCDLYTKNNLIIYGHHIKGGKMFGAFEKYKSESYYKEHKLINFDTTSQTGQYEIISVFTTTAYSPDGFRYYDYIGTDNEQEFNAYVQKCKELSLYDTGLTAEYGDKLLTLSTCEYSNENGRLVIVAKKL